MKLLQKTTDEWPLCSSKLEMAQLTLIQNESTNLAKDDRFQLAKDDDLVSAVLNGQRVVAHRSQVMSDQIKSLLLVACLLVFGKIGCWSERHSRL